MRFGVVGLGRVGGSLAAQALGKGHEVVGYNRSPDDTRRLARDGLDPAYSYEELARKLPRPRLALVYVPHGDAMDEVVEGLLDVAAPGDVVVDGGNSHWRASLRRHAACAERGVGFVDCGTSGGLPGARHGACFMVGGEEEAVARVAPLLEDLAVPGGFRHVGPPGAGHLVKLVHNAIEFAMVKALAEGVHLLRESEYGDALDLADVADVWAHGSVIRGWLVDLLAASLRDHADFEDALTGAVEDTKEGKWYVQYALEREVPVPLLALAELAFYGYRDASGLEGKVVALLRNAYGGHALPRREEAAARAEGPPA